MAMEGANTYRKGLWTEEEDRVLMDHIRAHGKGKWNQVARVTGLKRCGKSCRLRWINYLSPNVKRGDFSEEEEDLIVRLHNLLGNRWSLIAGRVPGRTDNQVKNHWNTHLSKKLGINKGTFKVSGSRRVCSEGIKKSSMVTSELNSDAPPDGNSGAAGPEAAQDSVKGTIGFGSSQEWTAVGGGNESSFWSSNDDLNPYTPGLLQFLDCYSLDFEWQAL